MRKERDGIEHNPGEDHPVLDQHEVPGTEVLSNEISGMLA